MAGLKPEDQLQQLKSEIEFRVKITKNEIFKIGECLMHVKRICQQEKISFQQWISEHLDFSYETANNFMNVFKNCLGERGIAMAISPSILYTIAAPSFPEELRKHLLDSGKLEEITGGQLKKLLRKYKEGGFEAIQEDVDELSRVRLARNQIRFTFDMCENAMRTLKALREKMEKRGVFQRAIIPFEDAIKTDEPEAYDINAKLYSALNKAIDILDQAQEESSAISNEIHKRLVEIHGTVAS